MQLDEQLESLDSHYQRQNPKTLGLNNQKRSKLSPSPGKAHSPEQHKLLKKITNNKLTMEEHKALAIWEIYCFYARQHLKRDIPFEQQKDIQRMEKGEFANFIKDYGIAVPKTKMFKIFKKVSPTLSPLTLEQFKQTLPLLAFEHTNGKQREVKYKLQEIKFCLEYPGNQPHVKMNETIENLINGINEQYDKFGRKVKLTTKKQNITEVIDNHLRPAE